MTYISDIEAASLIQNHNIVSSEFTDESGSTLSTLSDGSTLTHQCDTSKPLGWEHTPVEAGAEVVNDAAVAPAPVEAGAEVVNDAAVAPAPEAAPAVAPEPPVVAEA